MLRVHRTFIFALTIFSISYGQPGVILSGPHNQVVAPGDIVYFRCHARGSSVSCIWHINDTVSSPRRHYNEKGFQFTDQQLSTGECNDTLMVTAHQFNNNTRIKCIARVYGQQDAIEVGNLLIAGPPLTPTLNMSTMYLANSTFKHTLSWDEPFSWHEFPIISYVINITNYPYGQVTSVLKLIDSLNSLYSPQKFSFTSDGDYCYNLEVSLVASNIVGDSMPRTFHTGHPIVIDEIKNFTVVTFFLSNGIPISRMSFVAPKICPTYQTGTYNAILYDVDGQPIHCFGPTEYSQEDGQTQIQIIKELKHDLNNSQHYHLQLNVESSGISHRLVESFDTFFYGFRDLVGDYCSCNTSDSLKEQESIAIVKYVASSALGGALLMLIVVAVLIALIKHLQRKKMNSISRLTCLNQLDIDNHEISGSSELQQKQHTLRPPNLKLEASNPIYEGALYETTPGESLKSLQSPPVTPSNDLTFRYTLDTTPKLPPPRKTSTTQLQIRRPGCEGDSDTTEYMVMSSTQSM